MYNYILRATYHYSIILPGILLSNNARLVFLKCHTHKLSPFRVTTTPTMHALHMFPIRRRPPRHFPVEHSGDVHIPIARSLYQYISGIEVPVREDNVVVVLKFFPDNF